MISTSRVVAALAAAVLGTGVLAVGASAATADPGDPVGKREDSVSVVLTADDDDDDDESADTDDGANAAGGGNAVAAGDASGVSQDGTNSRVSAVSQDRDQSRGDLTKDWTRDGGDRTRDHSRNQTNDRSRHDTR